MPSSFLCQLIPFLLLTFFFFPLFLSAKSTEDSATFALQTRPFISEPQEEPYLVREGESGLVLNCAVGEQYRNRSRYELEWTKVVGDTPNLISRNGRLFSASGPDGYELADSVPRDGGYHLRLLGVQLGRDNGRFFCALIDSDTRQQTLSEPARVIVLVPPQPPQVVAQPEGPVREGELVSVRCESQGGNPPPKFQWLFENGTKVPESWFHERTEGSRTVSTVQWHVKAADNGAFLHCQAWNRALKEAEGLSAETTRLNILYGPRVRLVPAVEEANVEEGETVPLLCTADANPPAVHFQWTHVGSGQVHPDKEWRLPVRRSHSGEFRCTATNSIDTGAARLRLNVMYGPRVRIKPVAGQPGTGGGQPGTGGGQSPSVSVAEGDRLVLDCEAEANPRADAISWLGPGGVRQNGTRLVLDSVNRAHSGNFSCSAWNTLPLLPRPIVRTGLAQLAVEVRRRPGNAVIVAKRTAVNVGDPLVLGCATDGDPGNPPAKFRWSGPRSANPKGAGGQLASDNDNNEVDWTGAQLRIAQARLGDNGAYKCVAHNEMGEGQEATVRVLVVEPARISRPLPPTRTLAPSALDVQLDCEAKGFPQPRVHWLRDGLAIPLGRQSSIWTVQERVSAAGGASSDGGCAPASVCLLSVVSSLRLAHPISWTDKANYSCVAHNSPAGNSPPATTSSLVSVVHEPVILSQRFADGMGLAAAEAGQTARLACLVSARPEPRVVWSRDGEELGGGNRFDEQSRRYRVQTAKVGGGAIDEFESVLELDQLTDRDYGTFVCEAGNGAGGTRAALEIRLQPKSRPQSPAQVRLLQSGLSWLLVGWRPGFDGGERQTFELEYRPVDPYSGRAQLGEEPITFMFGPSNWTKLAILEATDSSQTEHFLVHNLTQLRPSNSFWFRVRARNSRGPSDWSPMGSAGTEDVRDSLDIQSPEHIAYLGDQQRLLAQPLRQSAAHCLLVYVASAEDGLWRTLDHCFPLADSLDGSVPGIGPAERFKVRYCMAAREVSKCSSGLKIFVENHSSARPLLWMLALVVGCVSLLAFSILATLLCCRRRFHKANPMAAAAMGNTMNHNGKGRTRKWNMNGTVVDRIDIGTPLKNTPANCSQTDSGVFTLGSTSAMAATAVACNGMNAQSRRNSSAVTAQMAANGTCNGGKGGALDEWNVPSSAGHCGSLARHPIRSNCCGPLSSSSSPNHNHHLHSGQQQMEPYDFSNDPFLQEFAAANALGGIVVVENALHQQSSAEGTPSPEPTGGGERGERAGYAAKLFNEFSAVLLGNGKSAGRHSLLGGRHLAGPNGTNATSDHHHRHSLHQQHKSGGGDSNEQLVDGSNSENGSGASSSSASSATAVAGAIANTTSPALAGAGGRVIREIIV